MKLIDTIRDRDGFLNFIDHQGNVVKVLDNEMDEIVEELPYALYHRMSTPQNGWGTYVDFEIGRNPHTIILVLTDGSEIKLDTTWYTTLRNLWSETNEPYHEQHCNIERGNSREYGT